MEVLSDDLFTPNSPSLSSCDSFIIRKPNADIVDWIEALNDEGLIESQLDRVEDILDPDIFYFLLEKTNSPNSTVDLPILEEQGVIEKYQYFCSYPDCSRWSGSDKFCAIHITNGKCCTVEGCNRKHKAKGLCQKHYEQNRNRIAKRCTVNGCSNFAHKGGICVKHGAIKPRCTVQDCEKTAVKGGICVSHGAVKARCSKLGCTSPADKDGLCQKHHPTYKKCITCNYFQVLKIGTECAGCGGFRVNSAEYVLREKLKDWFPDLEFTENKVIEGSCLKYRPDFFLETDKGFALIIEVDEKSHQDYELNCEITRMFNIQQAIMMPTVWVRYNPDAYKRNGINTIRVKQVERDTKLRATIGRILLGPHHFRPGVPKVEFLYYPDNRVVALEEELESVIKKIS